MTAADGNTHAETAGRVEPGLSPPPAGAVPTVSVVVPTYNQPALLAETLGTVFAQTFADFEVVVVDDGSTDDTPARLADLARGDSRLRVVRQENRGIGAARNRGIDEARGRYVALLDHDDLWHPGKLAAQVAFMADRPRCVACSVPWATSDDPNRCVFDLAARGPDGVVERPLRALGRHGVFLISSAVLFDRARAAGLRYETERRCIEDTPFQLELFARGPFGIAGGGEPLMVYRTHAANYSSSADFSYNGWRMLRRLRREGRFAALEADPAGRADLSAFLAGIGRWAAVSQLTAGRRGRAAAVYARSLPAQVRAGRLRFVAAFPPLLLAPQAVIRRRWPATTPGAGPA